MKVGYQDAGSWTLKSTPIDRAQAAWLYAQFVTSKTVDVKKSHVGLTFIRESTIQHQSFTRAPNLGGLVEFYRSPARVQWSPTGNQRARLSEAGAAGGRTSATRCLARNSRRKRWMRSCEEQEKVLERLERAGVQGDIGLETERAAGSPGSWLDAPGAPVAKLGQ